MALISSPIKSDSIPTNFDARGNKSGDTDYGKYGPDISVYAEAQTNGDTTILNDKGKILATVKKGGSFVVNSGALDATKDKQLILNLEANKSSYVKEAANKVKDTLPSGTSIDDINKHFGATPLSSNTGPLNFNQVTISSVSLSDKTRQSFKENLSYPAERNLKQEQDSVVFTIKKYGSIPLNPTQPTNIQRSNKQISGTITLPIQPSISDSNNVQWGEDRLNPIQAVGAVSALNAALKEGKNARDIGRDYIYGLSKSMEAFGNDENTRNAIMAYFAGEAVGNQNLLSRLNGSVLNPNLELLFQGPQLRNFNFNFQLTPRSKNDVTQVRKIIRTFKQAMAVQRSQSELFLSAPFVFGIQYIFSKNQHPYLPRIKDCALTNFSVDYTPDGSYMTYVDGSMTSYRLTMQFQELTPIYNHDYGNEKDDTDKDTNIGY